MTPRRVMVLIRGLPPHSLTRSVLADEIARAEEERKERKLTDREAKYRKSSGEG